MVEERVAAAGCEYQLGVPVLPAVVVLVFGDWVLVADGRAVRW